MSSFDVVDESLLSAAKITCQHRYRYHCISKSALILTEIFSDTARTDKLYRSRRRWPHRRVRPRRDSRDPPRWRIGRSNSHKEMNLRGKKFTT